MTQYTTFLECILMQVVNYLSFSVQDKRYSKLLVMTNHITTNFFFFFDPFIYLKPQKLEKEKADRKESYFQTEGGMGWVQYFFINKLNNCMISLKLH